MDSWRAPERIGPAIWRINVRISAETCGRPGPCRWDSFHQYRLNRQRCQLTTVAGCTITRAVLHSFQIFMRIIQNKRSRSRNLGRGRLCVRVANCGRRAAFSNATCLWPTRTRMINRNVLKKRPEHDALLCGQPLEKSIASWNLGILAKDKLTFCHVSARGQQSLGEG